ncbi:ATP-binding protein [Flavitalea sp. BT771]|uniref:ATP-binding protein n=1 Tax=Flavitalea sp. BT771 TaxID=3063329 RepID=UPI0026E18AE1|nr:ATP-binding protein [Flavitalea sp. BT771]MDO6433203.1 ATP-binding protein [Flavitalea sp. BT771]MDV6221521.1 ATP-binding protein [Flavitalea sp. BT771]
MAKLRSFAEDLIIKRIRLENPWWDTGLIPSDFQGYKPRLYFELFYRLNTQRQIKRATVLMGTRRVGKTVMLLQLVQRLINEGTPAKKICFLSIDAPIYNNIALEELFGLCQKALNDRSNNDFYIIFDEIQYLKNWEIHLKSMVDVYPSSNRFIVSGSAAAALKLKSNESGAGRFTEFMLPPLTFQEYLHLKDLSYLITFPAAEESDAPVFPSTSDWQTLNEHFLQYINFGGYPEVVLNEKIQQDPGKFVRSDIIDKVLLRDLPSLYGIRDVQELNSLFNVIAYNSGNEFNLEGLSQESGVDKLTIRKYIEYLEAAFLIKILYPVGINTKKFQRASRFKIYLTNPSMRCALFAPIGPTDDHFGQMAETAIVAQWLHEGNIPLHFAAWTGGEVDIVVVSPEQKPYWALEVKWSNQYVKSPGKLKSLIRYCRQNGLDNALVTSIDKFERVQMQELTFYNIPAATYCFVIGKNSLINRSSSFLFPDEIAPDI